MGAHNYSIVTHEVSDIGHADANETSAAVYYTVAVLMSLTGLTGTFFNGVAIVIFVKNKHLRTPTNSFVMALCVCDFFMCVIGVPIPTVYAWRRTAIESHAICIVDGFAVFFLALSSMYIHAAISVDRYVVNVRPLASFLVTQRVASLAIGVCFLVGLFWTVMPLLGWNRYTREGIGVACSISWQSGDDASKASYIFAVFVFCLILPLVVMVFCYGNIYRTVGSLGTRHYSCLLYTSDAADDC